MYIAKAETELVFLGGEYFIKASVLCESEDSIPTNWNAYYPCGNAGDVDELHKAQHQAICLAATLAAEFSMRSVDRFQQVNASTAES